MQGSVPVLISASLVAVVWTREATPEGIALARRFTSLLATKGFGTVSGLAQGIDQVAHQVALDYGVPTVGVMGTGILITFPAETSHIRSQIVASGGAIVTEYFPHDSYSRERFVRRNRIIAGLAQATIPVEARAKSGTAHTYRYARDAGLDTFGIRWSSRPATSGIHDLFNEDGRPIFDLDSEEDVRALLSRLNGPVTFTQLQKPRVNSLGCFCANSSGSWGLRYWAGGVQGPDGRLAGNMEAEVRWRLGR